MSFIINKPFPHGKELTNPDEISMFKSARVKHIIGAILTCISWTIYILLITLIVIFFILI